MKILGSVNGKKDLVVNFLSYIDPHHTPHNVEIHWDGSIANKCFMFYQSKIKQPSGRWNKKCDGGLERALWIRLSTSVAEDLGWVPSAHVRSLTAACNSSPKGSI